MSYNRGPERRMVQKKDYAKRATLYIKNTGVGRRALINQSRAKYTRPGGFPGQYRQCNPETKTIDLNTALYTLNSTAQFTTINLVQTGSSYYNRIGRKIHMKHIYITGVLTQAGNNQSSTEYGRVLVVYDKQTNGVLPSGGIADVIGSINQAGTTSSTAVDHLNLDKRDRFRVLMDERIILPNVEGTSPSNTYIPTADPEGNAGGNWNFKRFIKVNLETQYQADSSPSVIGDIATGGLYLITFGTPASGSDGWKLRLGVRCRFIDN